MTENNDIQPEYLAGVPTTNPEDTLEWDADSTEGADVPEQELPDFEPALFLRVPGAEVIRVAQ